MNPRLGAWLLLLLVALQPGCFSGGFAPKDNVDFAVMQRLGDIDGRYRDVSDPSVSESGDASLVESLSTILWGSATVAAATVEARAEGPDRVAIRSFDREGKVLREQVFVLGKDFEFEEGRMHFSRGNLLMQNRQDELFGPDVTTIELGLDQRGDGKVRTVLTGAGVIAVLPAAGRQTMEYRFPRIGN